jgi:hypothetical protein
MSADFLSSLELSIKTSNLLRAHNVSESQFLNMSKEYWRSIGGLVKGWKEIEEVRPGARQLRADRRRASTIGKAVTAVRTLNEIQADLCNENLFITKDDRGNYRVGRYISKEDLADV